MKTIKTNLFLVALVAGWLPLLAEEPPPAPAERKPIPIAKIDRKTPVNFEKEILPIFKNNCLACHNKTTTKADLNLETPQDILKGSESGKVIVPKRSSESLLLQMASHQVKPAMPPRNNKVQASDLTSEELGLIQLWIDQGATGEVQGTGPIVWQPLPEGLNPIYSVALTSDGQFAACARANQIFLYQLASRQLVGRLTDAELSQSGLYGQIGAAHRDLVHSLALVLTAICLPPVVTAKSNCGGVPKMFEDLFSRQAGQCWWSRSVQMENYWRRAPTTARLRCGAWQPVKR
jgi:hypothetical protein